MLRSPGVLRTIIGYVLVLGVLGGGASGCGGGDDGRSAASGMRVVATTMQLQDIGRQVGGDRVRMTGILGPADEPHEYEPTPADADAVAEADLVLENGANLDGWLADLLAGAGSESVRVVASRGIALLPSEEEGFSGDPHVWHDPEAAMRMVDNVAAGLGRADPPGEATYMRNAAAYKRRLRRMARAIRVLFEPIPPERRKLITSHDAMGYFARAYDVRVVGSVLPSLTTDTEPSGRRVRQLVETIRREQVSAIFTEEAVEPRLERQIAEEAGATVSTSLYADVLGAPGSGAETLVAAELANARAMARAWAAR